MHRRISLYLMLVMSTTFLFSQVPESGRKSIHQTENEYYSANLKELPPADEKGLAFPSSLTARESGVLKKMVLGWHPYWASSTAHETYDYTALSHIAYFSYEVDTATAVDWSGSWDFKKLSELCDYLIVMGYDYYWPVMGEGRKSTATGKATARVYSAAQQLAETYSRIFDMSTSVPRVSYFVSSAWRQMWFEDTLSLSLKYQLVNSRDLAGIGIWAISYEGSYEEVWSTINHAFSPAEPSFSTCIIKVYPNPAVSGTKIEYSVSTGGKISLIIYDLTGRERLVLMDDVREAGSYSEDLDPGDLRQGVYLCVIKAGKITSTTKIVVINR